MLWLLVMPLVVWVLPGWLLVRWVRPTADLLEQGVLALALGIATVAPTGFLITLLGGIPASRTTALLAALLWTLVGAGLAWSGQRDPLQRGGGVLLSGAIVGAGLLALTSGLYAVSSLDLFWHCPHLSTLYLLEDGTGGGFIAFDPWWGRQATHLFAHPTGDGFGLGPVLAIQRAGNAAFLAQAAAFLSTGGFALALWCSDLLVLGGAMLLVRRRVEADWTVALLAILVVLGARALAAYQLNENYTAFGFGLVLLHLLADREAADRGVRRALAAGVLRGILVGIRPVLLLCIPAALVLARGWRAGLGFAAVAAVAVAPWAITNVVALGDLLRHPPLEAATVPHVLFEGTWLEWRFEFHPLGWPIADQLMRPPGHPFPVLLRLPLTTLQAFGAPVLAAALLGLVPLWRSPRRLVAVLLWPLPILAILLPIVALDYQKLSYGLLAMVPLPLLLAEGVTWLAARTWRLLAFAGVGGALLAAPQAVTELHLPLDERQHIALNADPRDLRSEEEVRADLTTASFGPAVSLEIGGEGPWAASLLLHAMPAVAGEEPPIDGPVTLWTPLSAGKRPPPIEVRTTAEPLLPPGYLAWNGLPGAGPVNGRLLYLVELPPPAPDTGVITSIQRGGDTGVLISAPGQALDERRYITVMTVNRETRLADSPLLVDGRMGDLWQVSRWVSQTTPTAAVISNVPVSLHPTGEGFALGLGEAPAAAGEIECERGGQTVVRTCVPAGCTYALNEAGRLRALVTPDVVGGGSQVITWSPVDELALPTGPCAPDIFSKAGWRVSDPDS